MDERILPGLLTLTLIVIIFALMWWGWRNKLKRQGAVAPLPAVPAGLGEASMSVPGQYVVTTSAGDWLDRLAVHGLGIRTPAVMHIHADGILLERRGAQDLFLAKESISEVGVSSGMAGKFVERNGLVVIGWHLADTAVDTGFRTTEAAAKPPLLAALQALLASEDSGMANSLQKNHAPDEVNDLRNAPVPNTDTPNTDTPAADSNGKSN